MTNEDFKIWRERHFPSRLAAANALELHRETIDALESGYTRNGTPYPVRAHIELACAAIDHGLMPGVSRDQSLAAALREAANLIESGGPKRPGGRR